MILIAAGSNLPFCGVDSQQIILSAFSSISRFADVYCISPLYQTPAWPDPADPPFVNAVASIGGSLSPAALLAALHAVEAGFGRCRNAPPNTPNAPRTLDLDLLAYHELVTSAPARQGPQLPHPRLAAREFVLAPLCEIAPGWRHPVTGKTAKSMLEALERRDARRIS